MKTCPLCEKGTLKKKTVPYTVYGFKLGDFPAEVCSSCGESWFGEETAKQIETEEKKRGLFGLSQKKQDFLCRKFLNHSYPCRFSSVSSY